MSVTETIRFRRHDDVHGRRNLAVFGTHEVLEGSFDDLRFFPGKKSSIDMFVFDPPGLDDDASPSEVSSFMRDIIIMMDEFGKENCVVIMPFRDRKGSKFLKSTICASTMAGYGAPSGWSLFRQFIWMTGQTDFHRSRSAFAPVFVWRRGEMPSVRSPLRYTDVFRYKDSNDSGAVWSLPVPMLIDLIELFRGQKQLLVCDPFAGSGSVMRAADTLGLSSLSIELHKERAAALSQLAGELSRGH